MSSATSTAEEESVHEWTERVWLARATDLFLRLAPFVLAWLAIRFTSDWFVHPEPWWGIVVWLLQAAVVAGIVANVSARVAQRLSPLSTLLRLSLVWPNRAPARFRVALRAGAGRTLATSVHTLPAEEGAAAERALEMIAQLSAHDRRAGGHSERVCAYAELIAREMGVDQAELPLLRWGVLVHDIGKVSVPPEILNKEGRPTRREWDILRSHPAESERILQPLKGFLGPWIGAAAEHHERFDGDGYPRGLAGNEISLAGRICAVADAYDVITSKRSYKDAFSHNTARTELVKHAGTQFDPKVVRAMLNVGLKHRSRLASVASILETPIRSALITPSRKAS